MATQRQIDFERRSAEQARDAGIGLVGTNNAAWMTAAVEVFKLWSASHQGDFIAEDYRETVVSKIGQPNGKGGHAWGALTMKLIRSELIEETGRHRKMKRKASHARKSPVYRLRY
jgi:hypothetical protein